MAVRRAEEMLSQESFVGKLLAVMGNAAELKESGGQPVKSRWRDRFHDVATSDGPLRVSQARFVLGANDGAYLRSNVMPLQTADGIGQEKWRLSQRLIPELEIAGKLGMLAALNESIDTKIINDLAELKDRLAIAKWMLSIHEVANFVQAYLGDVLDGGGDTPLMTEVASLAFDIDKITVDGNHAAVCELLRIMLLLFDRPKHIVNQQIDHTLGPKGTGTGQLTRALSKLALSARFSETAFLADAYVPLTPELMLVKARAVSLNILTGRKLDYSVVAFPAGWDDSDEGEGDGSFTGHVDRMRRLIQKRADLASQADSSLSEVALKALVPQLQEEIETVEREKALHKEDLRAGFQSGGDFRDAIQRLETEHNALLLRLASIKARIDLCEKQTMVDAEDDENSDGFLLAAAARDKAAADADDAYHRAGEAANNFEKLLAEQLQKQTEVRIAEAEKAEEGEKAELDHMKAQTVFRRTQVWPDDAHTLATKRERAKKIEEELQAKIKAEVATRSDANRKNLADRGFFSLVGQIDSPNVQHALAAGLSQMREDFGGEITEDRLLIREQGINLLYNEAHSRSRGDSDWWEKKLYPDGQPDETLNGEELWNKMRGAQLPDGSLMKQADNHALVYALARGLCAKPAPHHRVGDRTELRYNVPTFDFAEVEPVDLNWSKEDQAKVAAQARATFGNADFEARDDFVEFSDSLHPYYPSADEALVAKWAPVTMENATGTDKRSTFRVDDNAENRALATSVVLEHLVDNYLQLAVTAENAPSRLLAFACAAFSKLLQMPHLSDVFAVKNKQDLANPHPVNTSGHTHCFVTRPVLKSSKQAVDTPVLYPCDAGLAAFRKLTKPVDESEKSDVKYEPNPNTAFGTLNATGSERVEKPRSKLTSFLRNVLARGAESGGKEATPLYIAAVPLGCDANGSGDTPEDHEAHTFRPNINPMKFPAGTNGKQAASVVNLEKVLKSGMRICVLLESYQCEKDAIERSKKEAVDSSGNDDVTENIAKKRREAVWNDSLREACISGDRLYAFVRQLSGTISEQVDAVCMIDEGMLVRQQQQRREQTQRLTDRAAQEHMQLVRNVFGSVIRESSLTLGIDNSGDVGQLKVVSNSLRKQASELAGGSSSTDGFFSNSVRLENLLSQGTGEMTLKQLFARIEEAGVALQQAAISAQPADSAGGSGTSLDYLSAPRNSLMLRYKPEALAAMRQAFDIFQREMRAQHGFMARHVTAFELIEGRDETLQSSFAQFSAHMLVHSRMYSSSTAMYVASWPAAANAQQLKISLQRLVSTATEYLSCTSKPAFLSETGHDNYF